MAHIPVVMAGADDFIIKPNWMLCLGDEMVAWLGSALDDTASEL
jgi:hypothetical protein